PAAPAEGLRPRTDLNPPASLARLTTGTDPMRNRFIAATLALFAFAAAVTAEDWPAWRGPRLDGTSTEKNIPTRWDGPKNENGAWKTVIPGIGPSPPMVGGDGLLVTSCALEKEQRMLYCLERPSGKILWSAPS